MFHRQLLLTQAPSRPVAEQAQAVNEGLGLVLATRLCQPG
jgi:hypothetical protein